MQAITEYRGECMKVWIKRIFTGLGILLLVGIIYAAFAHPTRRRIARRKMGAGSSSVEPAWVDST